MLCCEGLSQKMNDFMQDDTIWIVGFEYIRSRSLVYSSQKLLLFLGVGSIQGFPEEQKRRWMRGVV